MVSVFLALVAYLLLMCMQASLNQAQDAVQQMQSLRDDVLRLQADIHTAQEALQTSEVIICLNILDVLQMLRNVMFQGCHVIGRLLCPIASIALSLSSQVNTDHRYQTFLASSLCCVLQHQPAPNFAD